ANGNVGASDLQQAQPLAKQGMCKHMLDGASCKDEDADEASGQFLNHDVYKDLKISKHRLIKAFYSGKKKVYELKTRSGRSIKASANHPFLKLEGWIPLEKLKKGDRVGLYENTLMKQGTNIANQKEEGIQTSEFMEKREHCLCLLEQAEVY